MRTNENRNDEPRPAMSDGFKGAPAWMGLHPAGIITHGTPSQPVETMMGAQAGVYRLIMALGNIRLPEIMAALRALRGASPAKLARNYGVGYEAGEGC